MNIRIKRLHLDAVLPVYAHGPQEDAGMDLRSVERVVLTPGVAQAVPTGLAIELPPGYEAQVRPRSGLGLKHSLTVNFGTIDPGYRGEIRVIMFNLGTANYTVEKGDRIAQLVVAKYEAIDWEESDLGDSAEARAVSALPAGRLEGVSYKVTLIPGDGIGPEVSDAARRAIDATGVKIDWEIAELNSDLILKTGQSLPQSVVDSIERTSLALKGPVTTPIGGGYTSVNVGLRKRLDLYANVRPVHSLPGVASRFSDVNIDMVIFRENTEDLYSGLEQEVVKDVVTGLKVITRVASIRIAEYAFKFTAFTNRKKVTAIHKANIMKLADGLFLRCCREVAARYPEIKYEEMIVDNASMQLVMRPEQFDVLLLPNLYGDIVSDLAAGLVGGLGMVPGANMGETCAVFEAVHGSAPDIAGRGVANPTAMILSGVLMLQHMKELEAAKRLQTAVEKVYAGKTNVTADVGGTASTTQFTDSVIAAMK